MSSQSTGGNGRIRYLDVEKNAGTIALEDGSDDVNFEFGKIAPLDLPASSQIMQSRAPAAFDPRRLRIGQLVQFVSEPTKFGPRAVKVAVLPDKPPHSQMKSYM